jgi:5,10-methylenetetrahydromethanopterin reductase
MRFGVMLGADGTSATIENIVATAKNIEAKGFDSLWMPSIFSFDAISTLSIVGRETDRIRLGTAVTPTYPRHPTAIAQQALTAAAATGNRFTLGIGLSHKIVIENMLGLSYDQPARHMREYLSVLMPLLRGEELNFDGKHYNVHGVKLAVPGADAVPTVVAALGPAMLKTAGELADGTSTWMVGPRTMEKHIVKRLTAAADAAGRPAPRIVGGVPIALTNHPGAVRANIANNLAMYGQLPSYRAMLDLEGVDGPGDIAIVGNENALHEEIDQFRNAGVTDLNAAIMNIEDGTYDRTLDFLANMSG